MTRRSTFALVGIALAASACARANPEPAAQTARERWETAPSRIAFITSERESRGLSAEIRFGGPLGRSALLLQFPNEWRARGVPRRAFLRLSPRAGSASAETPVTIEAWRISGPWQATLRSWSEKPSLAPPYARADVSPSPSQELRLDVSEIVSYAARNPEREFGIAVIASGGDGPGATFSSGFAGGRAPRLELYLP